MCHLWPVGPLLQSSLGPFSGEQFEGKYLTRFCEGVASVGTALHDGDRPRCPRWRRERGISPGGMDGVRNGEQEGDYFGVEMIERHEKEGRGEEKKISCVRSASLTWRWRVSHETMKKDKKKKTKRQRLFRIDGLKQRAGNRQTGRA